MVADTKNRMKRINIGNKKVALDFGSLYWTIDENDKKLQEEVDEEHPITTTAIALNNHEVITGHSNGCIKIWDLKSGEIKAIIVDKNRFPPHSDKVTTLNMNKDF